MKRIFFCFLTTLSGMMIATAATFTVDNAGDAGAGAGNTGDLRYCINQANASPGMDDIVFDIPGAGPHTITLTGGALNITEEVLIDGATQNGYNPANGLPMIVLTGSATQGLIVSGGTGSAIHALAINNCGAQGLLLQVGNNTIQGCYIGTNATGTAAAANAAAGILLQNSHNNLIGGTTVAARNIISGNNAHGLEVIQSTDNDIRGNYIGVGADGLTAIGNTNHGILAFDNASRTHIGAAISGAGNVISSNGGSGINIDNNSIDCEIKGNIIGLAADGTTARPNQLSGIFFFNSPNPLIGGTTYLDKNTISANISHGIDIEQTTGVVIQGNFVGTTTDGLTARSNIGHGIQIRSCPGTIIGGSRYTEGNIVSASGLHGILFEGNGTSPGSVIKGNLVGTDSTATQNLGNGSIGVVIKSNDCIVGDTANNEGNVIAGTEYGLLIANANNTDIRGNFIGVGLDTTTAIPNVQDGILIAVEDGGQSASNNTVMYNMIAHNGRHGVNVGDALNGFVNNNETGNVIRFNQIFCNNELGISLHLSDPADWGNNGNPAPQINMAMSTETTIVGVADPALANQKIDVYLMVDCPSCDINPQGKLYIDSTEVDGAGNWSYDFGAPIPGTLVATATDAAGNTSQFSTCIDPCIAIARIDGQQELTIGPHSPVTLALSGTNSETSPLNPTPAEYTWLVNSTPLATTVNTSLTFQFDGGGGNLPEGDYAVELIVEQASCVDTATLNLKVIYFYVPNMVTPNGDPHNETFMITTENNRYNVEIYNRWGKRIFFEEGYTDGWNLSDINDGVYFYNISDAQGTTGEHKGWVKVMR